MARARKSRVPTEFEKDLTTKISGLTKPTGNPSNPETYSERSVKLFVANVYKTLKGLYSTQTLTLAMLNKDQEVREYLVSKYKNPNTRSNMLNAIIMVYRPDFIPAFSQNVLDRYMLARDELIHTIRTAGMTNDNQKKVLDKDKGITSEDILKLMKELRGESLSVGKQITDRNKYMLYLILYIHSQYPFRNDLAGMRVIRQSTFDKLDDDAKLKDDFLVLQGTKRMFFVRSNYKTKSKYGTLVNEITDTPLKKAIHIWLESGLQIYEDPLKLDYTYLLSTSNGSPISKNNLSQFLTKHTKAYLGLPISTTLLTKIFDKTPKSLETATEKQLQEMKRQAEIRGHSLMMKKTIYANPNNA